jgi:hypothetical protein
MSILIAMVGIVQNINNLYSKKLSDDKSKLVALLTYQGTMWHSDEYKLQKPFYKIKDDKNCNIYTLSQQTINESFIQINASQEEVDTLSIDAPAIMEKIDKYGEEILASSERIKYNRMKEVFPKLSNFKNNYELLERIKAVAYLVDIRYENAIEVWEKNLGDIAGIDASFEKRLKDNPKYYNDFRTIYGYIRQFDEFFPWKEFYEQSIKSPTEVLQ